jgi:hypothetical protein
VAANNAKDVIQSDMNRTAVDHVMIYVAAYDFLLFLEVKKELSL